MSKKRLTLALIAGVFVVAIFAGVAWIRGASEQEIGLLKPDDTEIVALGKEIYVDNCASCHGSELQGAKDWRSLGPDGLMPAPPHDKTGHTWHHTDDVLFSITKFGVAKVANLKNYKSAMPVYEGVLSDKEIIAVLSYIKNSWPDDIRKGHDKLNKRQ